MLANNVRGMFTDPTTSVVGFEKTFQVNHVASFLLTDLLKEQLIESRAPVINTFSIAARLYGKIGLDDLNNWRNYNPNTAYGNAKLANILFTGGSHDLFHDQGLSAVAFHPGFVATNFASDTKSRLQYYDSTKRISRTHRQAYDPDMVRAQWQRSADMLAIQR